MKKIIAISMVAVSLMATSAFSQGYFVFSSGKSQVYDGFTTAGASALSSHVDIALFWAVGNNVVSPMPIASTPTTGNNTTLEAFSAAQAWTDILNGTFTEAQSNAIGGPALAVSSTTGVVKIDGGATFDINGTSASSPYTLMLVSWNSAYANPLAAQAAGSAIGWSTTVNYTSGASITDGTIGTPALAGFGTFIPATAPEPGTLALAALGGAAMLFIRRKK
jgi:hypothetical protein